MDTIDLLQDRAWAIHPAKMEEINLFVEARINGEEKRHEAARGKSGNRSDDEYAVVNGVAVIPVYGVLGKRMNIIMDFSGGTSTQLLRSSIEKALRDKSVDAIVLDIDSPGGSVDGTKEVADFIFENRSGKPIVAYANGMMASGATWIGTAAESIVAFDTTISGNIGVVLTHFDRSKRDEEMGVKRTEIYAGKYKRIATDTAPLSDDGRDYLQSMVDSFYSIFVEAVARNRGVPVEKALEMADGKDFVGKQALEVGLVDMMGTLEDAIALAKAKGVRNMDLQKLKAEHPDLYQEVLALGAKSVTVDSFKAEIDQKRSEGFEEGKAKGASEEHARCSELLDAGAPFEATKAAIKNKLSLSDAYKSFFEAKLEEDKRMAEEAEASAPGKEKEKELERLRGEHSETLEPGAKEKNKGSDGEDFMALVDEYEKDHKCKRSEAMSAMVKKHPKAHAAWLKKRRESDAGGE